MINIIQNTISALRKGASGSVPDRAPRALNVAFTGTLREGNVLTGTYTYYDANGDAEGATSFKWYRADNSGEVGIAIGGATSETYTSTASDVGKYISFEVTPRALTGTILVGTPTFSPYQQVESIPIASNVAYTGTLTDEQVQTGTFTYSGSRPQGTSTFRWLRATDDAGTSATAIGGATSETYTLQSADAGNFVAFEVTPISDTGLVGSVVVSSYRTQVQDIAPIASAVSYTGTLESTEVQTGVYTYSGNTEGTSTFIWYRADDINGTNQTAIAGATSQTYTLQSADVDKHVAFMVTPVTINGKLGTAVRSDYRAVIASGASLLLDTYSGAAVAYSLRQLDSNYTGSSIRVRRSSDNVEQDIGFANNILDTSSLLTFVGGGDGFVDTWYDQSGNAKDMTQSTASRQPKIVSLGNVLLENGKPILTSDGSTSGMTSSYIADSGVSAKGLFIVTKRNSSSKQCILGSYSQGNNLNYFFEGNSTNTLVNLNVTVTSQQLNGSAWSYTDRADVYTDLANQSIISSNAVFNFGLDAADALGIGYRFSSPVDAEMTDMQELIIFENQTDQSAKVTAINNHYSAY